MRAPRTTPPSGKYRETYVAFSAPSSAHTTTAARKKAIHQSANLSLQLSLPSRSLYFQPTKPPCRLPTNNNNLSRSPTPRRRRSSEKDAARAMKGAESWKPSFARQQSFSKEEQKRELQMTGLGGGKSAPGFSEK
ncbi:hypothetical protein PG991_006215 [Apiospora marii]|uniref:Uncharacterized protein n=1 Tax=Apiospora marii TaxID=335849 RepID=A0ABR1SD78_9PEZI